MAHFLKKTNNDNIFLTHTTNLMAFTGVTNAHVLSPQPTACRSPTCNDNTFYISTVFTV